MELLIKIQSAKLTVALDAFQKTATELIVTRLRTLAVNIQGTMTVFSIQNTVLEESSMISLETRIFNQLIEIKTLNVSIQVKQEAVSWV